MRDFQRPGRSGAIATGGMVATSHPLAAVEALNILREGGNAVDAAIAGAVLLGVCEPHMTGIGGDLFALIKPSGTDEVTALNASGRAPAGASAEALRGEGIEKIEPGHQASITIPCAIDGFCKLSSKFGSKGLEASFASAIHHFRKGVPIAPRVAFDIATEKDCFDEAGARHYLKDGAPYAEGDIFALPAQADLLKRIAKEGRAAFYEGEAAEDMVTAINAIGGPHTVEDFAACEATWEDPLSGPYRGYDLVEHPPNGQGATALLISRILERFDIASMDPIGLERLHLEAEATKLAYDARNRFIADPEHTARLDHMISQETADRLAALIDPKSVIEAPKKITEDVHRDTVLITVVDRDGMAVSLIYSIFATFGSGVTSDKYGILLHNRGSGFNLTEGHPNEYGPGKRPMHTILPAMRRREGRIDMAFGVMGGQYQAAGHWHVMSNMIDYGMDPQAAIDCPRIFADPISGLLKVERSIPEDIRHALGDLGHPIDMTDAPIGGAQAILIDHARGCLIGGSDPRKDGVALGL